MDQTPLSPSPGPPGVWTRTAHEWSARGEAERAQAQVLGIDAWHRQRRSFEEASASPIPREARLDTSRRREALRRQHAALLRRTEQALGTPLLGLRHLPVRRAVVAHRDSRFAEHVRLGLAGYGIGTVAVLDDGAAAVGVAVAEQPDLLLLEDRLQTMTVTEVLRDVALLCPATVTVVQTDGPVTAVPLLDAGACVVFARRVPPVELTRHLDALLPVDRPVHLPRQAAHSPSRL